MPKKNTSRKLSHVIHLILVYPDIAKATSVIIDEKEVEKYTPAGAALRKAQMPPLWEEELTDEEDIKKWGEYWGDWKEGVEPLRDMAGITEINNFRYTAKGLPVFLEMSRGKTWDNCLDKIILDSLEENGMSMRVMYTRPQNYRSVHGQDPQSAKGFLPINTWDSSLGTILPKIMGDSVVFQAGIDTSALTFWHGYLQPLMDAQSKVRTRATNRIEKDEAAVQKVLGDSFLSAELPTDMSLRKAREAVTKLSKLKVDLSWCLVSPQDEAIARKEIDLTKPTAADEITARWEKLSPNGQKLEYCMLAIGWLVKLIERKTGKKNEIDFGGEQDETVMKYGMTLADKIPARQLDRFAPPTPEEVTGFNNLLSDVVDSWLGRTAPDDLRTVISIFEDEDESNAVEKFKAGTTDLGMEEWQNQSYENVCLNTGLPEGRPTFFRNYTSDNVKDIVGGGSQPYPGAVEVKLAWHQMCSIAGIYTRLNSPQLADLPGIDHTPSALPSAPVAIREGWGRTPGIAVLDNVGLGKTLSALGAVGSFMQHRALQQEIKTRLASASSKSTPATATGPEGSSATSPHPIQTPVAASAPNNNAPTDAGQPPVAPRASSHPSSTANQTLNLNDAAPPAASPANNDAGDPARGRPRDFAASPEGLPACLKEVVRFGSRPDAEIPDAAHLILVPNSLLPQWTHETHRFMRTDGGVRLFVCTNSSKNWEVEMRAIRQEQTIPKYRTIVLASHSVVQRMYQTNKFKILHSIQDQMPRLKYSLPADTLFSFSWGSIWIDEAHEARTGGALWHALSAILELGLVKVVMTATPMMEKPE
ncbi:hypothetical protein PQX77_020143, partial [Marasmius sp. AFHP31]